MNIQKKIALSLLGVIFLSGAIGGYLYFSSVFSKEKGSGDEPAGGIVSMEGFFTVRIYYPAGNRLQLEERRPPKSSPSSTIAEATIEEYLKGPAGAPATAIPRNVQLLGVYRGADRILYINLSDEFRRNFQGDVLAEYLLLKGLYESLNANIEDIQDVKVLIEGKEVETLGGHFYLLYPLKDMVSPEFG
ncbi:MAG: GerMN domain-containing protein [Nitrospirota bacterium]